MPGKILPSSRDIAGSPDRFGWEWEKYSDILPEYEEQFRRWTVHLHPEDWRGRSFLDVGCGMGRNSFWPMTYGAREGVAVDIDDRSLAGALRNLAQFPNLRVERHSAYDLPFEDRFDIVFSIGVIHHLEHPARALARLVRAALPGGQVLIWVYGKENNHWLDFRPQPAAQSAVQPSAGSPDASPFALPDRLAVAAAARGRAADRVFPADCQVGFCAFALDRVRPDAAAHCVLLVTRGGACPDAGRRAGRCAAGLGERDVVVGHRDAAEGGLNAGRPDGATIQWV